MKKIIVSNEGIIEYEKAWDKQHLLFNEALVRKSEKSTPEQHLLLCEHPHVYTLGNSGKAGNMLVNDEFLNKIGAKFVKIDRGGDVTYHGYGQLVGYPILDIEPLGLGLKEYIDRLEQSIIDTVAEYGIVADRLAGATGVWLDPHGANARKIAAIGVRASRWITMHGFGLNVNTDLKYFSYINPCGFVDKGVTSIEKELGTKVDFEELKVRYIKHFKRIFDFE